MIEFRVQTFAWDILINITKAAPLVHIPVLPPPQYLIKQI
jgi:hypothetical protein